MKKVQIYLFLVATMFFLFMPILAQGALQQDLTNPNEGTVTRPVADNAHNMWLFTKYDEKTKHTQVFLQYFNPDQVTSSEDMIVPLQLTNLDFDTSSPIWGPFLTKDFTYIFTPSAGGAATPAPALGESPTLILVDTLVCKANESQLFYYLGHDVLLNQNKLYLGCIGGLKTDGTASSPLLVFSGVEVNGYDAPASLGAKPTSSNDDIAEIASAGSNIFYYKLYTPTAVTPASLSPGPSTKDLSSYGYAVTYIDANGKLHFLLHSIVGISNSIITNATNYFVVIDPNNYFSYDPTDSSRLYQWDPDFETMTYKNPAFDASGQLIAFGAKEEKSLSILTYQLGVISYMGDLRSQTKLTDFTGNISRPQFTPQFPKDPNSKNLAQGIFFEIDQNADRTAKLAFAIMEFTQPELFLEQIVDWCPSFYVIDGNDASRQHLDISSFAEDADGYHSLFLTYENVLNSLSRIYGLILEEPLALEAQSCTPSATTTPMTTPTIYANAPDLEYPLACMGQNPMIFPKGQVDMPIYHDADYQLIADSDYRDIVFLKTIPGGNSLISNIYDTENATECSLELDVNACTPEYLTANPDGDWDRDGIVNQYDNCPCSYNPTQYDPDGDGVGESYQEGNENGCDNCPLLSNPADLDNNGDGAYNPLDSDYRQTDSDNNGVGDACETIIPPDYDICGDTDTDSDGVYDLCDVCVAVDDSLMTDSDGDGILDLCPQLVVSDFGTYGTFGGCTGGCALNTAPSTNPVWIMMIITGLVGSWRLKKTRSSKR